jgi:hypothetical protein
MECLGIPFRLALASPGSTLVVLAVDADRLLPEPGGPHRETVPARDLAQGPHRARSRGARDTFRFMRRASLDLALCVPRLPTVSESFNSVMRFLGIGALVAGGLVIALAALAAVLLIGPVVFWLAWNVLEFGSAIGLPELGFWSIVLATLFLVVGWFGKMLITAIVFLVDPSWFSGSALVHWPETTFRNFIAVALLALLASRPHVRAQHG